jgi:CubicO group peptidase (beta-lactamase class C family)
MPDFSKVDALVAKGIADGVFPGAVYAIGRRGGVVHLKSAGRYMYCPDSPSVKTGTMWDMASCSKVVGCTSAAMVLFDEGKLKLDERVVDVLPEFGQNGKDKITVRNLLLHNSGLVADLSNVPQYKSAESFMQGVYASKLKYPTGTDMVYSDLSMITLGKMIEKITGVSLDRFVKERVFTPLGMKDTMYNVPPEIRQRVAPTEDIEPWRTALRKSRHQDFSPLPGCHPDAHLYIQGEVHDPSADVLDGISGNAGVFSTAPDLCIFVQMMMNGGIHNGRQIINSGTIREWTRRQSEESSRALGWDTPAGRSSAGHKLSRKSFGHTGYTGTSIWADTEHDIFVILLTNRVHPTSKNEKLIPFRPRFHDTVAEAFGLT